MPRAPRRTGVAGGGELKYPALEERFPRVGDAHAHPVRAPAAHCEDGIPADHPWIPVEVWLIPRRAMVAAGAERAGVVDERASHPARRLLSLHARPGALGPGEMHGAPVPRGGNLVLEGPKASVQWRVGV